MASTLKSFSLQARKSGGSTTIFPGLFRCVSCESAANETCRAPSLCPSMAPLSIVGGARIPNWPPAAAPCCP